MAHYNLNKFRVSLQAAGADQGFLGGGAPLGNGITGR